VNKQIDRIKEITVAEGKHLFWIFVHLWVLLGLFSMHKSIVLHERNLIYHQGFAFINALVLAKIMLLVCEKSCTPQTKKTRAVRTKDGQSLRTKSIDRLGFFFRNAPEFFEFLTLRLPLSVIT
jgi:hypothetical protein